MSAGWAKNETNAAKRTCDVEIVGDNGQYAPPGIDFVAAGCTFIDGVSGADFAAAGGAMVNKRRKFSIANITITATDQVNERTTKALHTLETGDGPFRPTTTAGGFNLATDYWAIYFDDNQVSWATSPANAYAGTKVNITADVTGMIFVAQATCGRGLWGHFEYTATQGETNHDRAETNLVVDGTVPNVMINGLNIGTVGFRRRLFCGARTTVLMLNKAQGFETVLEGAYTAADLTRLAIAVLTGKSGDYTTGTYTFKSLDGLKIRVTVTADGTGRLNIVIGDLT